MKKMLGMLLMLLLSMLVCFPSYANEPETLNLTQVHAYETATSLCFIEDTLYMLGAYGLYEYKENELTTVVDLSDSYAYRYQKERPEEEEQALVWEKAISYLFTDGQSLYGLHPYSGKIYQIEGSQLKAVSELPDDLLYVASEEFFREIKGTVFESGKLFLLLGTDDYEDYEKTELIAFDLVSQEYETLSPEGVQSISAGPEGKLLAFIQADESAIWQYDIASDTLEAQLVLMEGDTPAGIACYDEKPIYYNQNRIILAEDVDQSLVKAYLPVMYSFGSTQAACSRSGIYAYPDSNYVFLRDVSIEGEVAQKVLTLMGDVSPDIIIDFSIENPDIAIVSVQSLNANELQQAALSGDNSVDLLVLSAPGSFAAIRKKGYIASLNGNETLTADAKTLYPTIQEVIFDGDTLIGYPISINPQAWTVNETQWNNLGLGEYPTTYDELFEKIALWLDVYADDYPEYTLSDMQQMGTDNLVSSIVEAYIAQMESQKEQVTFDTADFRAILQSVSDHLDLIAEDHDQWGMALLSSYNMGFGTSYADQDMMRMLIPPTAKADEVRSLIANANILSVNAASKQIDEATKFIEYYAAHLPDVTRYMLHPDLNDPIESATYKSRVATLQEELKALETRLEDADDNKKYEIEEEIVQKQLTIEYVSENKWDISPESIDTFRAIAQNIYIPYQSVLLSKGSGGGYNTLISVIYQHCSDSFGAGEIEALIADLNRVSTMIDLENM